MVHRRHGTLPSYLLWALVVMGDLMLVVVNAGVTVLITLLCLATGGAVAGCASRMRRRPMPIKRGA
ncbi:hypothetical protein [Asanoa iriomotensis]|uniref:Uncharacterized protein n=1 Tax=Asanoa iriomotensis TaxID=234613 RepID=A0ABQ4CC55_9ACTN|nr:hypothetical protein [Asanoa iriomotensis]GIF60349.1 hypothetical protein Air01nite_64440 [Asanoa iriomotensis]